MKKMKNRLKPLTGITVIDLSRLIPGPFCSKILSDLGATVIKVENSNHPDTLKTFPPFLKNGLSALYYALNHHKKIIQLDWQTSAGQKKLISLIKKADVLLESFRPGVLNAFGLSPKTLLKNNKKLLIASITGFGQTGPLAHLAGHDMNFMSYTGLVESPKQFSHQWADLVGGGIMGALQILAALFTRERNKRGGMLDISMTDNMIYTGLTQTVAAQAGGHLGHFGGLWGRYRLYPTKDKKFVFMGGIEKKFWNRFCEIIDHPQWKEEKGKVLDYNPTVIAKLETIFKTKTRQQWEQIGLKNDICLTPVLDPTEVTQSEHVRARKLIIKKKANKEKIEKIEFKFPYHLK